MLVAIVAIICIGLSMAIQKSLRDQGVEPLSRGQLRYMRRKARKQGLDVSQIDYNPRRGTPLYPKSGLDRETTKILRNLERARQGKPPRAPRRRK